MPLPATEDISVRWSSKTAVAQGVRGPHADLCQPPQHAARTTRVQRAELDPASGVGL